MYLHPWKVLPVGPFLSSSLSSRGRLLVVANPPHVPSASASAPLKAPEEVCHCRQGATQADVARGPGAEHGHQHSPSPTHPLPQTITHHLHPSPAILGAAVPIHTSSSMMNHHHVHPPQASAKGCRQHKEQPCLSAGRQGRVPLPKPGTAGTEPCTHPRGQPHSGRSAGDEPGRRPESLRIPPAWLPGCSRQNSQRKYRALIIAKKNLSYFLREQQMGIPH